MFDIPADVSKDIPYLPREVPRGHNRCRAYRIGAKEISPASTLSDGQSHKVINQASTKDPITKGARQPETNSCENLDYGIGGFIFEIGYRAIMQEIKNTNTRKGLGDNVREDGGGRARIHGRKLGSDVVQLGERIDDNEDVGCFQPTERSGSVLCLVTTP